MQVPCIEHARGPDFERLQDTAYSYVYSSRGLVFDLFPDAVPSLSFSASLISICTTASQPESQLLFSVCVRLAQGTSFVIIIVRNLSRRSSCPTLSETRCAAARRL